MNESASTNQRLGPANCFHATCPACGAAVDVIPEHAEATPSDLERAKNCLIEVAHMYGVPPSAYPHIAAEFATIRCAERAKLIAVLRIALEGVEALLDRPTDHDMNSTREKREIRAAYQAGNRALDALRTALAKGADAP